MTQPELLESSNFNPLVPTKIITHGWLSGQDRAKGAGGPLLKDGKCAGAKGREGEGNGKHTLHTGWRRG